MSTNLAEVHLNIGVARAAIGIKRPKVARNAELIDLKVAFRK